MKRSAHKRTGGVRGVTSKRFSARGKAGTHPILSNKFAVKGVMAHKYPKGMTADRGSKHKNRPFWAPRGQ
jgi:hypothetical protein